MFINGADDSPSMHGLRLVADGHYGAHFKQAFKRLATCGIKATVITELLPRADNRIELDHDNLDYFGRPGLRITYSVGDYEQNGARLGAATMNGILDELGATKTGDSAYDIAHQLGTTRMGLDGATSVVDSQLRAHDVGNLYLVGGSVFPNGLGPTNPTLTIAALALRLAEHLQQVVR